MHTPGIGSQPEEADVSEKSRGKVFRGVGLEPVLAPWPNQSQVT